MFEKPFMSALCRTTRRTLMSLLAVGLFSTLSFGDDAFRDMQGNITTLEEQQQSDKWTVVMIWASDCHVCNKESGQYSDFHTTHADKDAQIIGISIDGQAGKDDAEDFIDRNGVIFPNLIADFSAVANWYQLNTGEPFRATPTFVVFGPEGKVRATQPGAVPPAMIETFMASNP